MSESLEAMVARIDQRTLATDEKLDEIKPWLVAHERRITSIEKWEAKVAGLVIGLQVACSAGFAWLFHRRGE